MQLLPAALGKGDREGQGTRARVHDLPEVRLLVREHQMEEVCCPACQQLSAGGFPAGVEAPAQYGLNVQALEVYLYQV